MDVEFGALRDNICVEIRFIFSLIVPLANIDRSGRICRVTNDSKIRFLRYCLSRSFAIKCDCGCIMKFFSSSGASYQM